MAARSYGQYCGVTTAVELVSERWALLIIRDLLVGPRRYTDLKQGLPKIPTNILSARLKELQEQYGLIPASTSMARWNWSARCGTGIWRSTRSPRVSTNARNQDPDLTGPLTA